MQIRRRLWLPVVLVCLAALSTACATTVNKVLSDPSRYRNRDVRLSGAVVDSFSVADRGVYRIDDHTGTIWVVSERGVPRRGADVKLSGKVREGFNLGVFGDLLRLPPGVGSGVVVVESSHKARY